MLKMSKEPYDPVLEKRLELIRQVPPRRSEATAQGRAVFLTQAQDLARSRTESPSEPTGWWTKVLTRVLFLKQTSPRLAGSAIVILIVFILLGSTVASVAAAQGSLPGQPLYGLKTLTENVRMRLAGSPGAQMNLDLELIDRRVYEVVALSMAGETSSQNVLDRLDEHLDLVLQHAAEMEVENFPPALEKIRDDFQVQEGKLARAQAQAADPAPAQLTQARTMLQARLELIEEGLRDPLNLREQIRNQERLHLEPVEATPSAGDEPGGSGGYGPGPHATATPVSTGGDGLEPGSGSGGGPDGGFRNGPGPQMGGTATPEGGYGPGPNPSATPQDSMGEGSGPNPDPGPGEGDDSGSKPGGEPGPYRDSGPEPTQESGGMNGPGGGGHGGRP